MDVLLVLLLSFVLPGLYGEDDVWLEIDGGPALGWYTQADTRVIDVRIARNGLRSVGLPDAALYWTDKEIGLQLCRKLPTFRVDRLPGGWDWQDDEPQFVTWKR